ncbi:MAG: transposase [Gemmatimonadetes bacterium]|nr:transposase [Gemmatimonadota bacterium]
MVTQWGIRGNRGGPAFASILFNALRQALHGTRLARATAETLRLGLLKIGARITVSDRRVKVAMDSAHPSSAAFARDHARLPG